MKTSVRSLALLCSVLIWQGHAQAATSQPRIVWDREPDRQIIVGFASTGSQPHIKLGTSTTESSWQQHNVTRAFSFGGSITTQFVYLSQLQPNTAYYFRACDSSGCGPAHWFKTAGASPQNMTFVAGGDSRTNRGERQQGNRLVAKVRPSFVYFGGDLTDNNTASQMNEWLNDWQLSFASDNINGVAYKYIPGLIVNVGNHEANDLQFLCKVFGMDMDRSNSCSLRDTYGAFNINGNQLRVYNLNSEFSSSSSDFSTQTTWLNSDLTQQGQSVLWRMASYHKPALPRTSSKPSVNAGPYSWAQSFYDNKMNVVFESDSHLFKVTEPVKPVSSGNDYQLVSAGTVYLGEGAWGAPKRTADRNASWLVDLASFSHFNILQFSGNNLLIRSALFTGEASTSALTREQREADPLALPLGLQLRTTSGLGDTLALSRDAQGRSIKVNAESNQAPVVNAGDDTSIHLAQVANLNGSVSDDGKPAGATLSIAWSKVSGPGTVTFANSNQAQTTASFSAAGNYQLRLTANDSQLSTSDTVNVSVSSSQNTPPIANFQYQVNDLQVTLSNQSSDPDGSIASSFWSFGDGSTSTASSPSHSYAVAGTYLVELTVTDNSGAQASYSQSVTVSAPPSGQINELEPNNSMSAPQNITINGVTVAGTMSASSDNDYFKVMLPAGKTIRLTLTPNSNSDYDLYLYNSNQSQIAKSTRSTGQVDTIAVTNTGSQTYARYVRVRYYSGQTGSSGSYSLDISWD